MNADKTKCTACDGEGLIHTGIEEAPTTMCERCGGSGKTLAERVTQPAQDRCCEHDSDCAIHNAPAYPVGPCDCTLSEKPAKEQVAAVRAVPFDILAHLQRQRDFSEATFGPGLRTKGVCDHIRKELIEVEKDPTDLREWIDVVILALDGAWRCGGTPQQIIDGIVAKQTKNEGRVWPDWRTADPNKAIEHDRSHDAAPSPQPELSGSICPMKTPAIPDEGANEFIELMADWRHAELGSDSTAAFDALVKFIDAWKDAACAVAHEEGFIAGVEQEQQPHARLSGNPHEEGRHTIVGTLPRQHTFSGLCTEHAELRQRATDAEAKLTEWSRVVEVSMAADYTNRAIAAEAKLAIETQWATDMQIKAVALADRLAEIQRGVHGLDRYGFDGTFGGDFGGDPLGPFVKIDEVVALLQPPSQSDTINLTQRDTEMLIDLIENPPEPNETLRKAFDKYFKDKY